MIWMKISFLRKKAYKVVKIVFNNLILNEKDGDILVIWRDSCDDICIFWDDHVDIFLDNHTKMKYNWITIVKECQFPKKNLCDNFFQKQ